MPRRSPYLEPSSEPKVAISGALSPPPPLTRVFDESARRLVLASIRASLERTPHTVRELHGAGSRSPRL